MAFNAGILTLVGTLIIFAITNWLIRSTATPASAESVAPKIYGMRAKYFVFIVVVALGTLFVSLQGLPYTPPNGATPDYTVSVAGKMWSWEITGIQNNMDNSAATGIPAGKLIEFAVSTDNVNHGIGIYNEAGEILTQTQAMPGYPASIYYEFDQAGTYHIVCMEFCGAGHQIMNSKLIVH